MSIAHVVAVKAAQAVAGSLIKAGISHFREINKGKHEFHGDMKSIADDFGMNDRLEAIEKILPDAGRDPAEKLSAESRAAFLRARERLVSMGGKIKEKAEATQPVSPEAGGRLAELYRRADELAGRAAEAGGIDRRAMIQGAVDTVHELKARIASMAQKGVNARPFAHGCAFLEDNLNALIARTQEPRLTLHELHEQSARISLDQDAAPTVAPASPIRNKA